MKPACMSDEDYTAWQGLNRRIHAVSDRAATPCWDCTAGHALEMRAIDRCDGTPGEPEVAEKDRGRGHEEYFAEKHARMLANIDRACELLDSGLTQTAAAKVMGVSPSAVSKWSRMREAA